MSIQLLINYCANFERSNSERTVAHTANKQDKWKFLKKGL